MKQKFIVEFNTKYKNDIKVVYKIPVGIKSFWKFWKNKNTDPIIVSIEDASLVMPSDIFLPSPSGSGIYISTNPDNAIDNGLRLDLVNYKPIESELHPIKKMLLVTSDDFVDMKFSEDISDYSLASLSDVAKSKIIEIIKEDNEKRSAILYTHITPVFTDGPMTRHLYPNLGEPNGDIAITDILSKLNNPTK